MPEADFDYSKSVKYVEFGVYRFSFTRKFSLHEMEALDFRLSQIEDAYTLLSGVDFARWLYVRNIEFKCEQSRDNKEAPSGIFDRLALRICMKKIELISRRSLNYTNGAHTSP